ncbi:MAG TPA: GTP 3',8-cyclase MoaA [Candidatus Binatia bacterium]|nr:GTP 3',8-cyclase MoaA [Candidatus Binatia bacterium]
MTLTAPVDTDVIAGPDGRAPSPDPETPAVRDRRERPMRDLRISVTDRCNFRCPYCMPRSHYGPGHRFLPLEKQLTAPELERLAGVFISLGVTKIRLTGGEPLLRRDLVDIVGRLSRLGVEDLALTTNGALLARHAAALAEAGLHRVTVSLDSLDPEVFAAMSDASVPVAEVLAGIMAAQAAGLNPIKLNCVVRRGNNEGSILELVEFARSHGLQLRFIEYMDVGSSNGWRRQDVVPALEILETVGRVHPLLAEDREPSAVARRYRFADGAGELGIIASVSQPFCGDCSRARLGSDGRLYTCLFAIAGLDLREPLRSGADDRELRRLVSERWLRRNDRYSEIRASLTAPLRHVEMSYIGG